VDAERILDRFRSALRADIARGGAKPLRSYLRQFGVRFADEITREYAAVISDAPGLSLGDGAPGRVSEPPPAETTPAPPPPSSLGLAPLAAPLTEKNEIARGGMGAILRVRDETLRRDLAMKVVLSGDVAPSRESILRFVEEARVQARLDHPGVAPIHHLGTDAAGRACFTMKLVEGRSLAEILAASRRGEERANLVKTVQTLLRVCETVAFAHDRGVVHRDLKPANVMVGAFGEVYVMDWGLAKTLGVAEIAADVRVAETASSASSSGLTQAGAVLGTPTYMPPEQAEGRGADVDARSDVYAVGAILYEALAGRAPYHEPGGSRSAIDTLRDVLDGPPPPLARFAPRGFEELVAVAEKAMARRREDRYPSAREMGEDLQRWIEGRVVRAHRTGAWAEFTKWVRRNKTVAASLATVVAVVVVASMRYAVLEKESSAKIAKQRDDALAARNAEAVARQDAVVAKDDAVKARDDAVVAARRADGLRLCTVATTLADENPTLASLLAYEGAVRAPGRESATALHQAMRGFGETLTLVGNTGYVRHGRFSPDGKRAYTGSSDGRVISWDLATGRELHRLAADRLEIVALELVDGGRALFVASSSSPARLLDAETFATLREFPTLDGGLVFDAALSPDRKRFATAEWSGARVVDLATGREIARFAGHGAPVTSVRWRPDGAQIASGGADLRVRVWNASDGRQTAAIVPAPNAAKVQLDRNAALDLPDACPSAAWDADGRRLVVASPRAPDKVHVAVFDAASGARLFAGDPAWPWFEFIGMMPDGRRAIVDALGASVGATRRQLIVDLATGAAAPVPWNDGKGDWRRPAFSKDGKLVALTAGVWNRHAVAVWSTETGARLRTFLAHSYPVDECEFSADSSRLLTCSRDAQASVLEVASDAFRAGLASRTTKTLVFEIHAMDGACRLLGVQWKRPGTDLTVAAELVDSTSGSTVLAIPAGDEIRDLAISFDGGRVVEQRESADRSWLEVVDVASGRSLARVNGVDFHELRLDGGGRRLAFRARTVDGASAGDAAYVLDVGSGKPPRKFPNPDAADASMRIEPLALSRDGSRLVAGQGHSGCVVWDVESGRVLSHAGGHQGMLMSLAFSPDGSRVASAAMDASVQIHDVATGATVCRCIGIPFKRAAVAFSPDGAVLAAQCPDVIVVFDARTGAELSRIPRPDVQQFVFGVAMLDGARVVGAIRDGVVRVWPVDPVAWFAAHRPRELTMTETRLYAIDDDATRLDRELRRVLDRAHVADVVATSQCLLGAGRVADAEVCARRAEELDPTNPVTPIAAASLADRKGDLDAAFAALRRAKDAGENLARYAGETTLANCRADPRWKALVDEK